MFTPGIRAISGLAQTNFIWGCFITTNAGQRASTPAEEKTPKYGGEWNFQFMRLGGLAFNDLTDHLFSSIAAWFQLQIIQKKDQTVGLIGCLDFKRR